MSRPGKVISFEVYGQQQDCYAKAVVEFGDSTFRFAFRADRSYPQQGYGRACIWLSGGWAPVHEISGSLLKSARGHGVATVEQFREDMAELQRIALRVALRETGDFGWYTKKLAAVATGRP